MYTRKLEFDVAISVGGEGRREPPTCSTCQEVSERRMDSVGGPSTSPVFSYLLLDLPTPSGNLYGDFCTPPRGGISEKSTWMIFEFPRCVQLGVCPWRE